MFFRHPSKRALQEWLNQGTASDSTDAHIAGCQRCASVLEGFEDLGDAGLSAALALAFAPPLDLSERLERRVAARLDSRVVLSVVSDLFGAGIDTSKLLFLDDPVNERPGGAARMSEPNE